MVKHSQARPKQLTTYHIFAMGKKKKKVESNIVLIVSIEKPLQREVLFHFSWKAAYDQKQVKLK